MNHTSVRSSALQLVMHTVSWRRSNTALQRGSCLQNAHSLLLIAAAGALFGLLLSLLGTMHLPDVGGSEELQVLSAVDISTAPPRGET
jgi:hypothetical protein